MLTGALVSLLDKAEDPRAIRAITWMLEKSTGFDTTAVTEWFQRNGFHRLGAAYGSPTWTGKSITPGNVLESSTVYACTKIISEDMGALPFHVYRRSKNGNQINRADDLPIYRILHDLSNPETSAGELVEALTAHALLTGDGYAGITRDSSGQLIYLWPWQPDEVRTDRNRSGALYYIRKEGNSAEKTYARADVFHLRGFTFDGVTGDKLLKRARQTLGVTLSADEYAGRFFANDATPGLVITFPATAKKLDPISVQALKEAWKKWHQGASKSHEPGILQEGADAKNLAPDNEKSQLLETRKYQVIEICRLFRMPPHKIAELDRATHSNIEQQSIDYIQHTLSPWIDRWRRAVYRCLLTVDEQVAGQLWAEHDVAGLLRGDFATQSEGFRKLLEKGVYSINEVRKWLNLNPIPGGDEHNIQLNLTTIQNIAEGLNLPQSLPASVGTGVIQ